MSPPLLSAAGARITVGGATAIEALTLETKGDRVLVVGDVLPLVAVLGALEDVDEASVDGGTLALGGCDVAAGAHRAVMGFAPHAPVVPPRWTVTEYLTWGARLGGTRAAAAGALAVAALERLGLAALGRRRGRELGPFERRAVALALALLDAPSIVVLDRPFEGLGDAAAHALGALVARATEGRGALVAAQSLVPSSVEMELAEVATDVCLLAAGRLVAHGPPADVLGAARLHAVTVLAGAEALRAALGDAGLELRGGPVEFVLSLPHDKSVTDVLSVAARTGAAVVRCAPLL
jgi:ABC-type multidrug transport system ATPase subunit